MDEAATKQARILIVDDYAPNVLTLERLLEVSGYTNIVSTTDSSCVLPMCVEMEPDLILLDLQMPEPNGFEVMGLLTPWIRSAARLPILVLTADETRETRRRALSVGASDFLSKPFDPSEVVLRSHNLLEVRLAQRASLTQNRSLERSVGERTRALDEARIEVIERLALAAEYRDDASGEHTQRVGSHAAAIARELGLDDDFVEQVGLAGQLHDVGKLGIADSILLKQGRLTPMEFEVMKLHCSIGGEILGRSRSRLLQLAEEVALSHHERWDGTGYPAGLKGEAIPLSGRIVAVADVFDTLTHWRPYKEPWSHGDALAELRRSSGRHLDPRAVDAFVRLESELDLQSRAKLHLVA